MSNSQLSRKMFECIRSGMTLDEVEAILGAPGKREAPSSHRRSCLPEYEDRFWSDDNLLISVTFNRETGRAVAWQFGPSTSLKEDQVERVYSGIRLLPQKGKRTIKGDADI